MVAGEEVVISKAGKPLVRLVAVDGVVRMTRHMRATLWLPSDRVSFDDDPCTGPAPRLPR